VASSLKATLNQNALLSLVSADDTRLFYINWVTERVYYSYYHYLSYI